MLPTLGMWWNCAENQIHFCILLFVLNVYSVVWIYKLSVCCRTNAACFDYAGTKDRRAKSAQEVTARRYVTGWINMSFYVDWLIYFLILLLLLWNSDKKCSQCVLCVEEWSIVMCVYLCVFVCLSVCLYVCLWACLRNFTSSLHQFICACCLCRGSVLL